MNDGKNIFLAFEGGYFGPSYYYYINEKDDKYEFRFGYSSDGIIVENDINDSNINIIIQSKEYYREFIEKILVETKNWKETYTNNNIMDQTTPNMIQRISEIFERNHLIYGDV